MDPHTLRITWTETIEREITLTDARMAALLHIDPADLAEALDGDDLVLDLADNLAEIEPDDAEVTEHTYNLERDGITVERIGA